jgi:hypothetical protein
VEKELAKNQKAAARQALLEDLDRAEPLVYLNAHGAGHVEKVIGKAFELLKQTGCAITAYEGYLLLCAIQFHDVGNIFGRDRHEQKCRTIMDQACRQIIKDTAERNAISHISMVHGGCWGTSLDTIGSLLPERTLFGAPVRMQLLAAVLRFADELADDSSRADRAAMDNNLIPAEGLIYHRYSESLHTVDVKPNSIELSYEFESSLAFKTLKKGGKSKFLLDEIYSRTLKMERERRYCMRFLRPHMSIDQIKAEIVIQSAHNGLETDKITYTLQETGYPGKPDDVKEFGKELRTGQEEREYLKKRKWEA